MLGSHQLGWLVEHFYEETIGIPYTTILKAIERSTPQPEMASMRDVIERRIIKVLYNITVSMLRYELLNPVYHRL